jgi:hypothetical protein
LRVRADITPTRDNHLLVMILVDFDLSANQ